MILDKFIKTKQIHPPEWLPSNVHFLADSGSIAYNTHNQFSDYDIFGFCTPRKETIFPHLAGAIPGFGFQPERFDRWSEQHIFDKDDNNKEYDFCILNIVNFVELCRKNNPDQLDVLFVPRECIRHITSTGEIIRNNRHKFLSKRVYYRYKGYAYSQLNKSEKENAIGKRKELRDKFGFDPKFLCHLYRLIYEAEMVLTEGDMDLRRHCEHIKYVKAGNVNIAEAKAWFAEKEKHLEKLYQTSKLPEEPDENEIRLILLNAIENHYGDLSKCIVEQGKEARILDEIRKLVNS